MEDENIAANNMAFTWAKFPDVAPRNSPTSLRGRAISIVQKLDHHLVYTSGDEFLWMCCCFVDFLKSKYEEIAGLGELQHLQHLCRGQLAKAVDKAGMQARYSGMAEEEKEDPAFASKLVVTGNSTQAIRHSTVEELARRVLLEMRAPLPYNWSSAKEDFPEVKAELRRAGSEMARYLSQGAKRVLNDQEGPFFFEEGDLQEFVNRGAIKDDQFLEKLEFHVDTHWCSVGISPRALLGWKERVLGKILPHEVAAGRPPLTEEQDCVFFHALDCIQGPNWRTSAPLTLFFPAAQQKEEIRRHAPQKEDLALSVLTEEFNPQEAVTEDFNPHNLPALSNPKSSVGSIAFEGSRSTAENPRSLEFDDAFLRGPAHPQAPPTPPTQAQAPQAQACEAAQAAQAAQPAQPARPAPPPSPTPPKIN